MAPVSGKVGAYLAINAAHLRNDPVMAATYLTDHTSPGATEQTVRLLLAARRFDEAATAAAAMTEGRNAFFPQLALSVADLRAGHYKTVAARFTATGPHPFTDLLRNRLLAAASDASLAERAQAAAALLDAGRDPLRLFVKALYLAGNGRLVDAEKILLPLAAGENGASRRALLRTIDVRMLQNNTDGAQRLLKEALKDDANSLLRGRLKTLTASEAFDVRNDTAEILLSLASSFLRERDGISAAACAAVAAETAPDMASARFYAAEAAVAGPPRAAVLNAYDALFDDPVYGEQAVERKAAQMYAAGRVDEALALLRARATDDRPSLRVLEGDILRSRDQFADAAAAYNAALQAVKDTDYPDLWHLYYLRGGAYERAGKWPQAEADLREALRRRPDHPEVLNYLGYALAERGQNLPESLALLDRAVRLQPDEGFIIDSLGYAHIKSGNLDLGVRLLERAVALAAGDAEINEHLGDAYVKVGRTREAAYQYRNAAAFARDPEVKARLEKKAGGG